MQEAEANFSEHWIKQDAITGQARPELSRAEQSRISTIFVNNRNSDSQFLSPGAYLYVSPYCLQLKLASLKRNKACIPFGKSALQKHKA